MRKGMADKKIFCFTKLKKTLHNEGLVIRKTSHGTGEMV